MAEAVAGLLDSDQLRAEMGERGRQLVRKRYSVARIREELRTTYYSTVGPVSQRKYSQ